MFGNAFSQCNSIYRAVDFKARKYVRAYFILSPSTVVYSDYLMLLLLLLFLNCNKTPKMVNRTSNLNKSKSCAIHEQKETIAIPTNSKHIILSILIRLNLLVQYSNSSYLFYCFFFVNVLHCISQIAFSTYIL